jgi:hypothetical protein
LINKTAFHQIATALEKVEQLSKVERQWRLELFAKLQHAEEPAGVSFGEVGMVCLRNVEFEALPVSFCAGSIPEGIQKESCGLVATMEAAY